MYHFYGFEGQDPVIRDVFRARNARGWDNAQLAAASGVSVGCLNAWESGRTKRPANATVEACLRAMGVERVVRSKLKRVA